MQQPADRGQRSSGAPPTSVFPRPTTPVYRSREPAAVPPASATTGGHSSRPDSVFDSQPRLISNLIVDQTETNPAAVAAAGRPTTRGRDDPGPCSIPNVAPDVGLSAPYNSWFTLFGQFFDHGLDLTTRAAADGHHPAAAGRPAVRAGLPTNFMVLTRATNRPGPDG